MKKPNYMASGAKLCSLALAAACSIFFSANAQKPTTLVQANEGGRLFSSHCGSCHGLDGKGGERAPDISGRREIQKLSDAALAKIIRQGVSGTGMPSFQALGDKKIQALVGHLRTLQGGREASSLPGSPAKGKVLFFGKAGCSECHMVNGSGGFIGSDLSVYGMTKAAGRIRNAILNPAESSLEPGRIVVATTSNGQTFVGIARNEDNFSLQLQTKDGTFHFFEKSSLRSLEHRTELLMPSDYAARLSPQEVDDVISYLMSVARSAPRNQDGKQKEQSADEVEE